MNDISYYIDKVFDDEIMWLKIRGLRQVTVRLFYEDILLPDAYLTHPPWSHNDHIVEKTYRVKESCYILFNESALVIHPGVHRSYTSLKSDSQVPAAPNKEIIYNQDKDYLITINSIDSTFIDGIGEMIVGFER